MGTTFAQHQVIWLEPTCDGCEKYNSERLWCQDDVLDDCSECGARPVKYVLAPDQPQKPD